MFWLVAVTSVVQLNAVQDVLEEMLAGGMQRPAGSAVAS